MTKKNLLVVLLTSSVLTLTACGGSSGEDSSRSAEDKEDTSQASSSFKEITVTPHLGQVHEGRVVLKSSLNNEIIDEKNIDGVHDIKFKIDIKKISEPLLVELLPTKNGKFKYSDPAIDTDLVSITNLPQTPILRAAFNLREDLTHISLSALTEASVKYAEKNRLTPENIEKANQFIQDQLNIKQFKILDATSITNFNTTTLLNKNTVSLNEIFYIAYLSTAAKEIKRLHPTSKQPAFEFALALGEDFTDGKFDASPSISNQTYDQSFGAYHKYWANAWKNWEATYYDQLKNIQDPNTALEWLNTFNSNFLYQYNNSQICEQNSLVSAELSDIQIYNGKYQDITANNDFDLDISSERVLVDGHTKQLLSICRKKDSNIYHAFIDYGNIQFFKNNEQKLISYDIQVGKLGASISKVGNLIRESEPTLPLICQENNWGCLLISDYGEFTHKSRLSDMPKIEIQSNPIFGTASFSAYYTFDNKFSGQDILNIETSTKDFYTSISVNFVEQNLYGDKLGYSCFKSNNTTQQNHFSCSNISLDQQNRTIVFSNTKLKVLGGGSKTISLNGTLRY